MITLHSLQRSISRFTNSMLVGMLQNWNEDDSQRRILTSLDALSYPAIWYGVNKIAGHVAQMPLHLFKRNKNGGADQQDRHPITELLRRPNALQIGMVFRQTLMVHSLLDGNGRAAIVRGDDGRAKELILLHPSCTVSLLINGEKIHATRPPEWDRLRLFFDVMDASQSKTDGLIVIPDSEVVHVLGLSEDGVSGIPLRRIAKRSIGASIDAESRVARQMKSGFSGKLFFQAPPGVFRKEEEASEFIEHVRQRHAANRDGDDIGMLREGITANVIDMSNKDAEMAAVRLFQRQDAALLLGLEGILGDDASVSYGSAEQKNIAYLSMLSRWLVPIEQELEFKLLTASEFKNGRFYLRFNTAQLLKSDAKTTMETLALAVQSELMTRNEARAKLDLNPIAGGDELKNPAINPVPETPATEPEAPETEEEEPTKTAALATYARLSDLCFAEAKRVMRGAELAAVKGLNFLEWMDEFYDRNWEPKLADWLEGLEIDRGLAHEHCVESKRRLLEVCDTATRDTLYADVSRCCKTWRTRANCLRELANV